MKQKNILVLGIILGIILISSHVSAGVPPPSAKFSFVIDTEFIKEGEWRLNFISIPLYKSNDFNYIKNYFNTINEEFVKIKRLCGLKSDFKASDCGIGCTSINAIDEKCEPYVRYILTKGGYGSREATKQIKFLPLQPLHYSYFHYSRIVHDKSINLKAFYPITCDIIDGTCDLFVFDYRSKGPHLVVLEKLDSREGIYFSDPINIPWNQASDIEWKSWESDIYYPLELKKFEIQDPNKFIIQFEGAKEVKEEITEETTKTYLYYLIPIIVFLIVVVSVIGLVIYKKNKGRHNK